MLNSVVRIHIALVFSDIPAAHGLNFFTIHYYLLPSKNPHI